MSNSLYGRLSGLIFLLVALAHACRAWEGWTVMIGSHAVPIWASWLMAAGGIVLGIWGMRQR